MSYNIAFILHEIKYINLINKLLHPTEYRIKN